LQTETGSASGPVLFTSCEMVYWKIIGLKMELYVHGICINQTYLIWNACHRWSWVVSMM